MNESSPLSRYASSVSIFVTAALSFVLNLARVPPPQQKKYLFFLSDKIVKNRGRPIRPLAIITKPLCRGEIRKGAFCESGKSCKQEPNIHGETT